jgi:hypothetical protein
MTIWGSMEPDSRMGTSQATRTDQQIAELGEYVAGQYQEEIAGHFPTGFIRQIRTDPGVFFVGYQAVELVGGIP